jgi:hypothetical protein
MLLRLFIIWMDLTMIIEEVSDEMTERMGDQPAAGSQRNEKPRSGACVENTSGISRDANSS